MVKRIRSILFVLFCVAVAYLALAGITASGVNVHIQPAHQGSVTITT